MYDKRINELEEVLNAATEAINEMSEDINEMLKEIADLKETNEWLSLQLEKTDERMLTEIGALEDQIYSADSLKSAIREIQDEMKKKDRKMILIHEV